MATSEDTPVVRGDSCTQRRPQAVSTQLGQFLHAHAHMPVHMRVYSVHMHVTGVRGRNTCAHIHACTHTRMHTHACTHVYNVCTHMTGVRGRNTCAHIHACTHTYTMCTHMTRCAWQEPFP